MTNAEPMAAAVDPSRCPLCGAKNDCGMVRGEPKCWCDSVTIPREAIDRMPMEAQGVACVCRACAAGRRSPAELTRVIEALTRR